MLMLRLVFPVRRRHLAVNSNGNAVGVAVIAMTSDWDLKEDLKLATVSGYVLGPALKPWFYSGKRIITI